MKKLRPVYWTLALILCLGHTSILSGYTFLCFSTDNSISPAAWGYWALIVLTVILLGLGMAIKTKKQKQLALALSLMPVLVLVGLLGWYFIDAPPIENDYTEKDLHVANSGGYDLLAPFFSEKKAEALRTDLETIARQTPEDNMELQAVQAWERISEFRTAIEQLDRFEVICDLPENTAIDMKLPYMKFTLFKEIPKVYRDYIQYELGRGNGADALRDLGRLHGVARKGMNGSALLIHKMMYAALAQKTMATAYEVMQNEHCGPELLKILNNDFKPLGKTECNMNRVLISEYLVMKQLYTQLITSENFLDTVSLDSALKESKGNKTSLAYRPVFYLLYKPNRTIALHRKYFDLIIEGEMQDPPDHTKAQLYMESHGRHPSLRNMIGWILNNIAMPSFSQYSMRVREKKVQSELLAWAIAIRLNNSNALGEGAAIGQDRFKEAQGVLRSPGPDGVYDTEDDVTLEKTL